MKKTIDKKFTVDQLGVLRKEMHKNVDKIFENEKELLNIPIREWECLTTQLSTKKCYITFNISVGKMVEAANNYEKETELREFGKQIGLFGVNEEKK